MFTIRNRYDAKVFPLNNITLTYLFRIIKTEESDEGEKPGEGEVQAGVATPGEGLVTPLGISSVPPGVETPDTIELRKKKLDSDVEGYEIYFYFHIVVYIMHMAG